MRSTTSCSLRAPGSACALAAVLAGALLAGPGCATAVQHPVPTLAAVGGVIGFGSCELEDISLKTCGIIGGSTAVFMGGVAALIYLLTDQPTPQMDGEVVDPEDAPLRPRHHAPVILPEDAPTNGEPTAAPSAAGSGSDSGSGSGSAAPVAPAPPAP